LKQIAGTDPEHLGHQYIVKLLDSFDHHPQRDLHACMVMEPLGETLLTLITRNGQTGLAQSSVKTITRQILLGLQFLHDRCDLVHT
jgi:serine/threonine-protein kinase SRPK3